MVAWHDPLVELHTAQAASSIATLCAGIYIWEFMTCFTFDWEYAMRRRPFRWTVLPYMIARYAAICAFGFYIYSLNAFSARVDCRLVWHAIYALAHASLAASSLLLVVRAIAIARFNRWAVVFLGSLWLAEVAMQFHSLVLIRGVYVPQLFACGPTNTVVSRLYMIVSFVLHLVCLALVLAILLRVPGDGLCNLLLSQGIVYFVVSMLGFTSSSVLLILNLNDGMNLSLQVPTLATMAICATRMYRGLVIYASTDEDAFTMTVSFTQRYSCHDGGAMAETC